MSFKTRLIILLFVLQAGLVHSKATVSTEDNADAAEDCRTNKTWSRGAKCAYVKHNSDNCEGGGYLKWTRYAQCQDNTAKEVVIIIFAVIFLLCLFVTISTAADDFFSPNVAVIVSYLRISESVAGVTFMAFGNGSPDVFGSIASVLSTPTPKAGLALGLLLGGNIFVTTMVTATIVLTKPFKIDILPTIRDLIFFLVTVAWIFFTFIHSEHIYIWEPAGCLGIYVIYVCTVIVLQQIKKRRRLRKLQRLQRNKQVLSSLRSTKSRAVSHISIVSAVVDDVETEVPSSALPILSDEKDTENAFFTALANPAGSELELNSVQTAPEDPKHEETDLDEDGEDGEHDADDFIVMHNIVAHTHDGEMHVIDTGIDDTVSAEIGPIPMWKRYLIDIWRHVRPFTMDDWREASIVDRIFLIVKTVPIFCFKLTIPLAELHWSKAVAIMHSIISPQFLLFAIQAYVYRIDHWGPGLYAYLLIASVLLVGLIVIFTSYDKEPKHYKVLYALAGFVMSVSWIYIIANEVVDVVTMLGVVLRLSHELLGLTVLSWSNSIGDLIADVAVVKQGFPRMAMAAAIGGPLFNLLIGFGVPFLIATAQGKHVPINLTPVYKIILLFLAISLSTTLAGVFIQKFYLRRPFAFVLIGIYLVFLVMVILCETNVLVWN